MLTRQVVVLIQMLNAKISSASAVKILRMSMELAKPVSLFKQCLRDNINSVEG